MTRIGIGYESVKDIAIKLLSQGIAPSVQKVREIAGTGSNTTIADHLKAWREEHAKQTIHHLPTDMPKVLVAAFETLWQTAIEQAKDQLLSYKQTLDAEREAALAAQQVAEQAYEDIAQKLSNLSNNFSEELIIKQQLNIELALAAERLEKQNTAMLLQQHHYEALLKQLSQEKEGLAKQCQQSRDEIKSLQEKLALQSEQYQHKITELNVLHEQSENRWLILIDQARQETKNTHKKIEKLTHFYTEKSKALEEKSYLAQKNLSENQGQLLIAKEQLSQFMLDIKQKEAEHLEMQSLMTKLQEQKRVKKVRLLQNKVRKLLMPA